MRHYAVCTNRSLQFLLTTKANTQKKTILRNFVACDFVITLWSHKKDLMLKQIVKIGNSKGLRLSSTILKKYEIFDKVEMVLTEEGILLKPVKNPREGWSESFKQMNRMGDAELLIDDVFEDEDLETWN